MRDMYAVAEMRYRIAEEKAKKEFIKFEFPWHMDKNNVQQSVESSKTISRRFWTTHNNAVLEWSVEFSSSSVSRTAKLDLTYIDGPSEKVQFECSIDGTYERIFKVNEKDRSLSLARGEKCSESFEYIDQPNGNAPYCQLHLNVVPSSFNLCGPFSRTSYTTHHWVVNFGHHFHGNIENMDSKHSDVRLISGDNKTFYCHRIVLVAQSETMDAIFRNARTEEEKNGTFRLSAWSTEELRKILAYFYACNTHLESLQIQELMNIYDFGEQHGLGHLKKCVEMQLWNCALKEPMDCVQIARFADLHDLKPLKYRCFDVLAENYVRLGLKVDEIFKEDQPDIDDGEPRSKKMRGSGGDTKEKKEDDVSTRLMHEFTEYLCGRMEGVRVLECGDKSK